ncbi:MAG: DASS family sodium-coupled anion symporter [Phycisphaerales bacterium]|nr:DASS family sodium-coupled anion symporter [Phycisphaerales bacterium]
MSHTAHDMKDTAVRDHPERSVGQKIGLVLGPAALVAIAFAPTPQTFVDMAADRTGLPLTHADTIELARGAQMTLAILVHMVVWWLTEAVPLAVTALIPGLLLPLLHVTGYENGRLFPYNNRAAFEPYASPIIYLFLAGFLLAGAMRKTGLDRRITLGVLSRPAVMRTPGRILFVMMGISAFLSMWISNTATTAMMLPIALMVLHELHQAPGKSRFGTALMLGIAWASSIGGLATLIGSPPNGIVAGILRDRGIAEIDFVGWMRVGLPISIVGLFAAWALLMVRFRSKTRIDDNVLATVQDARRELGHLKLDEKMTLVVFILVTLLWLTQPFWPSILPVRLADRISRFDIPEIGLFGAMLLFVIPIRRGDWRSVLSWRDAKYVDWGTLVLFGGGISLSNAMFKTGLTEWAADHFVAAMGQPSPWLGLTMLVLLVDFLTEITSNTAVTSMMTPVLIGIAPRIGLDPALLCIACGLASSLAFMLPVATPPNALVYASGYFKVSDMARAGFAMNLIGCAILVVCLYLIKSTIGLGL